MRLGRAKTLVIASAVATVCATAGLVVVCSRYRIYSYRDYQDYRLLMKDYALGSDLWFGHIQRGQDVESVAAKNPPDRRVQWDQHFVELRYYPGGPLPPMSIPFESMHLIARDGEIIEAEAAGCQWGRSFFRMSERDRAAYKKAVDSRLKEWEEKKLFKKNEQD
jgi:hypothetical protein